jgi:hypothetical protein
LTSLTLFELFTFRTFIEAADDYLRDREAIDAAFIFKTEDELDQSLAYLVSNLESLYDDDDDYLCFFDKFVQKVAIF